MKEVYLVTGASGHLGNAVVRALLAQDKRVRALVLPHDPLKNTVDPRAEMVEGDVLDMQSLVPFFAHCGKDAIVIHAAGIVSIAAGGNPALRRVNVDGTRNIVRMCESSGVKKLVYVSSVHAIPVLPKGQAMRETDRFDPDAVEGAYAKSKAEATALVLDAHARGLCACVVHPSGIIGPYDYGCAHMTQMFEDYISGNLWACVRGGYDFVDVRDVADGILACAGRGRGGQCYILSNRYVTVQELLETLRRITNGRKLRLVLPCGFIRFVAPLAEWYYKLRGQKPLFTAYSMDTLESNALFDNQKARRELEFSPRPIEQTLADTVQWLRSEGRLKPRRRKASARQARRNHAPS